MSSSIVTWWAFTEHLLQILPYAGDLRYEDEGKKQKPWAAYSAIEERDNDGTAWYMWDKKHCIRWEAHKLCSQLPGFKSHTQNLPASHLQGTLQIFIEHMQWRKTCANTGERIVSKISVGEKMVLPHLEQIVLCLMLPFMTLPKVTALGCRAPTRCGFPVCPQITVGQETLLPRPSCGSPSLDP